ncbi:phage terminase large subunit [Terrihalobacillus insolitus]|uniref:phage terminase large subunit n=1 Tax=Terrihalobacillus insolitus TaxID=2950438 RepID=UPI002341737E|nr:phage terminase large subunit [Terrihalobacillus insolitus]MDC3413972.1 phage terminase large subunit [Terrihalobacillus insolitus]
MDENVVGLVDRKYIEKKDERRKRMKILAEILDSFRILAKKGVLPESKKALAYDYKEEFEALHRIDRSEGDILYFAYTYFSEDENYENQGNLIPEGITIEDAPDFHIELTDILNVVSNEEINKRIAWSAPRGHAKSAYLSNVFPIHQVIFNKRKYILIISETDSAAKKFVEWVGNELKHNEKLRRDFGELLSPSKALNDKDNQEAFLTKTGTLVEAASIGKQLRGKRNGSHRPDLVICDDLESSKNTNTVELVQKNIDWFDKVVIPIGDPARTAFVYMGTTVVSNGLLQHVMSKADFQSKTFAAIVSPPERGDLWDELETKLRDAENPNRLEDAKSFYELNREEMDKGVKVLWEGRWTYFALIVQKANMTSRAFNSEFMNNPIDTENAIFKLDALTYFDYDEIHEKKKFFEYYSAWDIALGKNNRSDYNAIVTVARDKRTGIFYVVDAWAKKVPAHEALEQALKIMRKYKPKVFAVETVAAQHDFYRQLKEAMTKTGIYGTKLQPIVSRTKKEERIEMLEPLVENGALRFMRHQRLLLEQLEQFPNGTNDDVPDALQMAVDIGTRMKRRTYYKKPKGL